MEHKFTKAELIARKVLDECGLDDSAETDIKEIILGRGAFYYEKPLEGEDGITISAGGRSIVTINSNIPFEARKRYA